jgi:hypothetical protein
MTDEIVKPKSCSFVDGVGSSQAIDTAGEIVDLAGIDASSLVGGALNWEHKSDVPAQLVGKVLEYKKIFSEKDIENDRHQYYWDKTKTPFLYVMGRLFDDKKESSKECAAVFLDDMEHPEERPMLGFSIEGSKVDKQGIIVTKSIARKITITNTNANKQCCAELIPGPEAKPSSDTDSIFKSEPSHTIELLSKSEPLSKATEKGVHEPLFSPGRAATPGIKAGQGMSSMGYNVRNPRPTMVDPKVKAKQTLKELKQMPKPNLGKAEVPGSNIPSSQSSTGPSKAVKGAPGWSHSGGGNFHHPEHGIVSVIKQGNEFHVKHKGALAGVSGKKGVFGSSKEAGGHAGDYMRSLSQGKTAAPSMQSRPSPQMKSEERRELKKDQYGYPGTPSGSMASPPPEPNKAAAQQVSAGVNAGDVSMGQAWSNIKSGLGLGKKEKMAKSNNRRFGGMMGGGLPYESTDKKNKRGLFNPDVDKIQGGGLMGGGMGFGKAETGHEKGVATKPNPKFREGTSGAGVDVRVKDFGDAKKQSIGRMMEASKIKPKLVATEKGGNLKKAMTAGSGMAAPGNLVQGSALAPESLDRKMKKGEWLARAEQAYQSWEKREQFENFMAKHMPDLTKGEISAIGQTIALRKSLRAEAKLKKMMRDEGQDSWVKKKEK